MMRLLLAMMSLLRAIQFATAAVCARIGARICNAIAPTTRPSPAPAHEPPRRGWVALQGLAIEHAASGFAIQLEPTNPRGELILRSPEGERLAIGREGNLLALQRLAELCATERQQFNTAAIEAATLLNRLRADAASHSPQPQQKSR